MQKIGRFGLLRGHSRSLFNGTCTTSYSTLIDTPQFCTVHQNSFYNLVLSDPRGATLDRGRSLLLPGAQWLVVRAESVVTWCSVTGRGRRTQRVQSSSQQSWSEEKSCWTPSIRPGQTWQSLESQASCLQPPASIDTLTSSPLQTHTHTHTHTFNGPLSGTTRVGQYQKGKTNLDFTEARDSEWQWHQLGRMQVCTSLQTDNQASTPPLCFLQAGCPSCRPTNSVKALSVSKNKIYNSQRVLCLQCFGTVGWGQEGQSACKNSVTRCWCGYLSADCLHMVQLMPLPSQTPSSLASFKSSSSSWRV